MNTSLCVHSKKLSSPRLILQTHQKYSAVGSTTTSGWAMAKMSQRTKSNKTLSSELSKRTFKEGIQSFTKWSLRIWAISTSAAPKIQGTYRWKTRLSCASSTNSKKLFSKLSLTWNSMWTVSTGGTRKTWTEWTEKLSSRSRLSFSTITNQRALDPLAL